VPAPPSDPPARRPNLGCCLRACAGTPPGAKQVQRWFPHRPSYGPSVLPARGFCRDGSPETAHVWLAPWRGLWGQAGNQLGGNLLWVGEGGGRVSRIRERAARRGPGRSGAGRAPGPITKERVATNVGRLWGFRPRPTALYAFVGFGLSGGFFGWGRGGLFREGFGAFWENGRGGTTFWASRTTKPQVHVVRWKRCFSSRSFAGRRLQEQKTVAPFHLGIGLTVGGKFACRCLPDRRRPAADVHRRSGRLVAVGLRRRAVGMFPTGHLSEKGLRILPPL